MFVLYNILLVLASPVILVILLAKKRCRPGLGQRLGWLPQSKTAEWGDGRTIWVHAESMGGGGAGGRSARRRAEGPLSAVPHRRLDGHGNRQRSHSEEACRNRGASL